MAAHNSCVWSAAAVRVPRQAGDGKESAARTNVLPASGAHSRGPDPAHDTLEHGQLRWMIALYHYHYHDNTSASNTLLRIVAPLAARRHAAPRRMGEGDLLPGAVNGCMYHQPPVPHALVGSAL